MSEKPCRSKSRFGHCGLPQGHGRLHAVPIGDDTWFGYDSSPGLRAMALGYGHFHGARFTTERRAVCESCADLEACRAPDTRPGGHHHEEGNAA